MKNSKSLLVLIAFLIATQLCDAQKYQFTRQDTLRGTITPERSWWDLTYYHLDISIDIDNKSIKGKNTIQYQVSSRVAPMQIDLQAPMTIDKVTLEGKSLTFYQDGNAWFVEIPANQQMGSIHEIDVSYSGKPPVSLRPPWSGGFTWNKDSNGKDFIATSCQGDGASMWWPCKDHMYDEPDSMLISITIPDHLMDVSNGKFRGVTENTDGTKTWNWYVDNPINNYGVNVNIADYSHFSEVFDGEKGKLQCDYYVLPENLEKARKQFKQVPMMLEAFEHWFGPYPFYEDGFKLVEVPYLGMEHQSSVTYGNKYQNGYLGQDRSDSGWGMKFDFIIIHEAGHEWFANNITYMDIADMWVHEGFTAYSESLYLEYHYGKEAGDDYTVGKRFRIRNDRPIIGPYGVNASGSGDMYVKGANMLHTLRQVVNDDEKWRGVLRGLNKEFYHKTVTTRQIEEYMGKFLDMDLRTFFNQYLRDTRIPTLEYRWLEKNLMYRWSNCVDGFNMPVDITLGGGELRLKPTQRWQEMNIGTQIDDLAVDINYYVSAINHTVKKID